MQLPYLICLLTLYLPIIAVKIFSFVVIIRVFLSTNEFKLEEKSQSSPIIAGNASKAAINKLETNPHVIKIYYNTGKTTTALQDTVSLIKAYLVWKLQISSLNITGENTTYS